MNRSKVNILPCSGIGKAFGTISRWTAFEVVENLKPEVSELLCLARLVAGDLESSEKLQTNYNITLDGCPKKCAYKNVTRNNAEVYKSFLVAKFLLKNRDLEIDTQNITNPGSDALQLAKRIGDEISQEIDTLLSNGGQN